jgi:hypothetical protein
VRKRRSTRIPGAAEKYINFVPYYTNVTFVTKTNKKGETFTQVDRRALRDFAPRTPWQMIERKFGENASAAIEFARKHVPGLDIKANGGTFRVIQDLGKGKSLLLAKVHAATWQMALATAAEGRIPVAQA